MKRIYAAAATVEILVEVEDEDEAYKKINDTIACMEDIGNVSSEDINTKFSKPVVRLVRLVRSITNSQINKVIQ